MSALQKWHDAVQQFAEGWHHLKDRAETAITHFRPNPTAPQNRDDEALWRLSSRWALMPSDVSETANAFDIRLEVPGMNRDDFNVEVHGNEVLVRGNKQWQSSDSKTHFHRVECAYGSFERHFILSAEVDANETRARYRDGVLTLTLPKKSPQQVRRVAIVS